jgi:hypothetical protein
MMRENLLMKVVRDKSSFDGNRGFFSVWRKGYTAPWKRESEQTKFGEG